MTSLSSRLKIALEENTFARELAREISTPGIRPVEAIERLLSLHLMRTIKSELGARLIKEPTPRIYPGYSKNRWAVLPDLAAVGYQTWYPELRFATKPADAIQKLEVHPSGFQLEPINYGFGVSRTFDLKIKALKTQTNHVLRLNHLKIAENVFEQTLKLIETEYPLGAALFG